MCDMVSSAFPHALCVDASVTRAKTFSTWSMDCRNLLPSFREGK